MEIAHYTPGIQEKPDPTFKKRNDFFIFYNDRLIEMERSRSYISRMFGDSNIKKIKSIHGQYLSNTIEKKPKGWRNSTYSGVLNEMGSHVIDLILYIIENDNMDVLFSKKESIVSDIDDIVEAKLKTSNDISISMYFNWVKKDVRKPIFGLEIEMKDGYKYSIDQQQINKYKSSACLIFLFSNK